MVNKENIRLWVDALRSGEYKQANAVLTRISATDGPSHCCMGVACQVAIEAGLELDALPNTAGTRVLYGAEHEEEYLPTEVIDWLGVDNRNVELIELGPGDEDFGYYDEVLRAAEANDDKGWTFEQIADALEERYLKNVEPVPYEPHSW